MSVATEQSQTPAPGQATDGAEALLKVNNI